MPRALPLALTAAVLAALACKGGSAPSSAAPTPAAADAKPAAEAKPAADVLTIKNETGVELTELLVMPSEEKDWGKENLLAGKAIPKGGTGTVKKSAFARKGSYDLSFTGQDDSDYFLWELDVASADTITVSAADKDKAQ